MEKRMKIFKKNVLLAAAALMSLIILAACGADQPNDISGTFENGSITYIFAQDGTMQQIKDGVTRDGSYVADNGSLVIYYNDRTEKFDYTYESGKLGLFRKGMIFGSEFTKTADGVETIGTGGPGINVVDNETTTEAATENVTEAPTEKPSEPVTEKPTEAPTEDATEKPAEAPTESPSEVPVEVPTKAPAPEPAEEQTEAPAEYPNEEEPGQDEPEEEPGDRYNSDENASLPSVPGVIEGDIIQGSIVTFGHYEIDNDQSNGQEAIEWKVLFVENNKALLVSRYALDCKYYDDAGQFATWQDCSLRYWLNNDFMNTAFNDTEQAYIAETELQPDENKVYGGLGVYVGGPTTDRVFILSATEMYYFFESDYDRQCTATWYAEARGATHEYVEGNGFWSWLRTPGRRDGYTALLYPNGSVDYRGTFHTDNGIAVRPALCIEIN